MIFLYLFEKNLKLLFKESSKDQKRKIGEKSAPVIPAPVKRASVIKAPVNPVKRETLSAADSLPSTSLGPSRSTSEFLNRKTETDVITKFVMQ